MRAASRWTAVALVLVLALGACGKSDATPTTFERLQSLVGRFVDAIAAGDAAAAHALLCRDVAARAPVDALRAGNPFLQRGAAFDAHDSLSAHDAAELAGWLTSPAGTTRATFYASRLDGVWCLTGALIGGTPLLPTYGAATAERQDSGSAR